MEEMWARFHHETHEQQIENLNFLWAKESAHDLIIFKTQQSLGG